jgi:hypothetical protein
MINDLISSATAIKAAQHQTQLSYAVAAKQLDAQRQQGNMAVQLLAAAQQVGAPTAKPAGPGHVDVYA